MSLWCRLLGHKYSRDYCVRCNLIEVIQHKCLYTFKDVCLIHKVCQTDCKINCCPFNTRFRTI